MYKTYRIIFIRCSPRPIRGIAARWKQRSNSHR